MDESNLGQILNSPELQSNDIKKHIAMAHNYIEQNVNDLALIILTETVKKFPDDDRAYFELGYLYYELNNVTNAIANLRRSIELNPNRNSKKYFTLAEISEPKDSIQFYEAGIKLCAENLTKQDITGKLNRRETQGDLQFDSTSLLWHRRGVHVE